MESPAHWWYDEFRQVGTDYGDPAQAAVYDACHANFRDLDEECRRMLDALGLGPGDVLADFGAGTGNLSIAAARRSIRVHAVDVSQAMLSQAKEKAAAAGLAGIAFHHAGFLTAELPHAFADAAASSLALHHLPDFWKGVALARVRRVLKPGGRFFLQDMVLTGDHCLDDIAGFIARQEALGGAVLREDAEQHFREEFSTHGWVMEGLLERAGFEIVHYEEEGGVLARYLCVRPWG